MAWQGEPIADDALAEVLSRVAAVEEFLPDRPSYFEILTAAALRLVRRRGGRRGRRRGRARRHLGRHEHRRRSPVAVVTNVSVDHVEYLGRHPGARSPGRRPASCRTGATLVLGETDPELRDVFEARQPARIVLRDRDFGVRGAAPRARRPASSTSSTPGRRLRRPVPAAARRAPGRQRGDRARRGRGVPRRASRRATSSPTRSPRFSSPGRLEVVGHQPLVLLDGAHNVAGAHALRRARSTRSSRAARARSSSGCCARRSRTRCSTALGVATRPRLVVLPGRRARARSTRRDRRGGRVDLGLATEQVEVVESVAGRGRPGAARPRRRTGRSSSPGRCTPWARPGRSWCPGG